MQHPQKDTAGVNANPISRKPLYQQLAERMQMNGVKFTHTVILRRDEAGDGSASSKSAAILQRERNRLSCNYACLGNQAQLLLVGARGCSEGR